MASDAPQTTEPHHRTTVVFPRYGTDHMEWEASWFAAAFLMPEQWVRRVWEESGGSVATVAEMAKVPVPYAKARAIGLGLLAEDET